MENANSEFLELENSIRLSIKQARKAKGINQETMGKILGISKTSYSEIESGKTSLPLSRFLHIAETLELENLLRPIRQNTSNSHDTVPKVYDEQPEQATITDVVPIQENMNINRFQQYISNLATKDDVAELRTMLQEVLNRLPDKE